MKVCQAFLDAGHDVRLWLPAERTEVSEEDLRHWYGLHRSIPMTRLVSLGLLRRYDFSWRAVYQARRWKADLVYCWPLQAAYISTRRGLPTALEIHDQPHGRFAPALMKSILGSKYTVRVLPITSALRSWLAETYNVQMEPPRTVIVPMGVDLEPYRDLPAPEHARALLNLKPGISIGYTGHLYPGRGLELMASLARLNPEINMLWVGGEPVDVERWRRRLEGERITNLALSGFIPNEQLPLYQAACEILLMPYQHAIAGSSGGDTARFASPMKVFEYLAAGRAILSSDLPVLREVLDETCSVLLSADDLTAWDQALKGLLQDPEQRAYLGKAAADKAQGYSWMARAGRILGGLADG